MSKNSDNLAVKSVAETKAEAIAEAEAEERIALEALTNWIDSRQACAEAYLTVEKAKAQLIYAQKAARGNELVWNRTKAAATEAWKLAKSISKSAESVSEPEDTGE